ncbi:MAG: hypothetical protein JXQ68_06005 [Campylobacterales bacterium]|nr:hypothetical protein [Campylobacterales bacterium]
MNQFTHNLYTILDKSANHFHIQLADASHPLFQAHFENNPILPAFSQLDILQELIKKEIVQIKKTKFKDVIKPLDIITFIIKEDASKLNAKIQKNEKTVSEMSLEVR